MRLDTNDLLTIVEALNIYASRVDLTGEAQRLADLLDQRRVDQEPPTGRAAAYLVWRDDDLPPGWHPHLFTTSVTGPRFVTASLWMCQVDGCGHRLEARGTPDGAIEFVMSDGNGVWL